MIQKYLTYLCQRNLNLLETKDMQYKEDFLTLWEQVKESIEAGTFAKLTLAKPIGKPDLKNIFLRPVYSEKGFTFLLKFHYRQREMEDKESELSIDDALLIVKEHLRNPFMSAIAFTTEKDLQFKINKKGVGTITENYPTFTNVTQAVRD